MVTVSQDALDALATPIWVIEVERAELTLANQSALALFAASNVQEINAGEPMRGAGTLVLAEIALLAEGARLEAEFEIALPQAEVVVSCTVTGILGPTGERLALVEARPRRSAPASSRDAELEQRLQSRDRMASIGTLTAGVVHGINNPLSYVIANLEYVKRLLARGGQRPDDKALAELGDIVDDSLDGAERVRRIVSDLGSFSRPGDLLAVAVDLERAAERAVSVAQNEIRHRARIVREFSAIPAALGTEAKLAQVVLNVLINSTHAIEAGAVDRNTITLRTRMDAHGRPTLEIEDTGCGIAPENLSRVFDPFFTTKPVGVGAGIGLSIAQRIVRELDGEIELSSEHGVGTRVVITLPKAPHAVVRHPVLESVPPFSTDRRRFRILVVDDEPAILRAFRRVLAGDDVSVASSGSEALAKLGQGTPFDVIFCDVMMPEMSGVELYRQISQQHPGREHQIVFVTGGAFTEPAARFIGAVKNPTLKKPFTGSALRELVATVTRRAARDQSRDS